MILQALGLIGIATLLFICVLLSLKRNTQTFLVVGQYVFRWMAALLVIILALRILTATDLMTANLARNVNSIVFLAIVGGIVWSVRHHGRKDH